MVSLVQQGLGWVPTACNLSAALAFGLCLSLNAHLTGGSDLSIFAIAPLLLLLTQVPTKLRMYCVTDLQSMQGQQQHSAAANMAGQACWQHLPGNFSQ
jgi:hypothetical protein